MRHLFLRVGSKISRRWVLVGLALVLLAGAALVFLPAYFRGGPSLQLVALGEDGRFGSAIRIPAAWSDSTTGDWGPATRVPLILGLRNSGLQASRPERLSVSVPARFRLVSSNSGELSPSGGRGAPLVQYNLGSALPAVPPGGLPTLVAQGDTLWLQPVLPSIYCIAAADDSVPEFLPAPPPDPRLISTLRIFYSLEGGGLASRQTGLLDVRLDPALVRMRVAPALPTFPAEIREPRIETPALSGLIYGGSRRSFCGEPEQPTELFTTTWETLEGGRFLVLALNGVPRKHLYDLDRDSIVELETWDPDGDGDFEARRQARFAIPSFLLPLPEASPRFDTSVYATLSPDSAARLNRFRGPTTATAFGARADTLPRLDRFGRDVPAEPAPRPARTPRRTGPELLGVPAASNAQR